MYVFVFVCTMQQTPLHLACKNGRTEVVELFLKEAKERVQDKKDVEKDDIILRRDELGRNCLDFAIDSGNE